jgi:hypothetical protein
MFVNVYLLKLGPSWSHPGPPYLKPSGTCVGPSWGYFGGSWVHVGPSWSQVGPGWLGTRGGRPQRACGQASEAQRHLTGNRLGTSPKSYVLLV